MSAEQARGVISDADVMLTMTPMPSRSKFLGRLLRSFGIATTVIGGGLFIGMLGYHALGGLSWLESF